MMGLLLNWARPWGLRQSAPMALGMACRTCVRKRLVPSVEARGERPHVDGGGNGILDGVVESVRNLSLLDRREARRLVVHKGRGDVDRCTTTISPVSFLNGQQRLTKTKELRSKDNPVLHDALD